MADIRPCNQDTVPSSVYLIIDFFSLHQETAPQTPRSHLFPTKVKVEVLEISEAFDGEARAAQPAGHIGQRGEVVAQHVVALRLHLQLAVAVTSCVVL